MRKYSKKMFYNIINNTSLAKKYIYANIFILMIPCVILVAAYFFRFQKTVEDEISSSYEQVMDQYVANVSYKLDLYRNIEETISVNSMVQQILSEEDIGTPMEVMKIMDIFSKETRSIFLGKNQEEVHSVTLYTYNDKLPTNGEFIMSMENAKNEGWFNKIEKSNSFSDCYFKIHPHNKQQLVLLLQPIIKINGLSLSERLGIIQIGLYANRIFKPTSRMSNNRDMEIFILDDQGNIVYGDKEKADSLHDIYNNCCNGEIIKDVENHKISITRSIYPYSCKVIAFFSYNEVNSRLSAFVIFSIVVVVIILIISLSLTVLFSNMFTKRIHLLIGKMKRVEEGELNITDVIEGEDEVGLLDKQFNSMTNRLRGVINENYIRQLEKREAELNALQLQINPHFLYNTLESISAIAAINNCFDICSISQKLGDMFRYNISTAKNEFVFLRDEINHIKNYIYIQDIRFDGRFNVVYDIPDTLLNCRILKFILQPIIENAISHGLEEKEGKGKITISAESHENVLYLAVQDDGIGISSEKLDQINTYIHESGINIKEHVKRSIGLKNVDSRVKMVNGSEYGVTVKSQLNVGTQVIISLPYR